MASEVAKGAAAEALKQFKNTGHRQPTYKERAYLWNSRVAPSFGNLKETIQSVDEITKVAIIGATKEVLKLKQEARSWDAVVGAFNNSTLLKQEGEEYGKYDFYKTSVRRNWFKSNSGINKSTLQEVHGWFEKLINDSDILATTQINIEDIKNIVATTGHAISQLGGKETDSNYREISIAEFGVIRYPQLHEPYFKLYSIQLFAWTNYQGCLFRRNNNGIKGVFLKRIYKPNQEIIEKMKAAVINKAVREAEDLVWTDD